jgi:hypothetical protein
MKNLKYSLYVLLTLMIFAGCQKEKGSVQIVSLSTKGSEFFFGEKVTVWATANINDHSGAAYKSDATYKWECDGGTFTGVPGLFENVWVAPKAAGKYHITVTVSDKGSTDVRTSEMYVSSYFYDKFESATTAWKNSDALVAYNKTLGRMELSVKTAGKFTANFRYEFADTALKAPFSCKADIGWTSKYPAAKLNANKSENNTWWRFQSNRPPHDMKYVDDIRIEFWPVGIQLGVTSVLNGRFRYETYDINTGIKVTYYIPINDPAFAFTKDQVKTMAFTLTADHTAILYMGGVEFFRTTAIKDYRTANGCVDPYYVFSWRYEFPSSAVMFIDNAYLSNDGTDLGTKI